MAFTSQGGQYSCRQKRHAWAYTGGILVSFFIVSFILFMLQKAGALVGWGFQMQSPPFVMLLFFILFLVGLNLSGFFHLSGIGGDAYHRLSQEHSLRSSFFTGILATAVATPCTAPLMASALGYALSAPFHENILIFQSLGLGLAFPFLFMAYVPFIAKNLPKPGLWMVTLKEVLAFLMYASAVWLLWVLSIQIGPYGVLLGGGAMVWITFLIWLMQRSPRFYKIGIVCLILSITGALILTPNILAPQLLLNEHRDSSHASNVSSKEKNDVEIIPFDKEKLESLRKQGRSVFVEVTAAWCLTCKFNEISVLNTKDIQTLFKNTNTILMIADWTNKDPQITQYLGSFGAQGVPFYVHYHGEKTPTVLGSVLLNKDTMHKILHPLLPKEPKSPKS
jgi:thiol:disulfide interchange protein DsbD